MAGEVLILDYFGANLSIVCQSAARGPNILIGERGRSWLGNERSQTRGEKRTWNIRTTKLPTEIKEAIERIIWRGTQVHMAGEAIQQNPVIDPLLLSSSQWAAVSMTRTTGVLDPNGGLSAQTLASTAANATVEQQLPTGMLIARTNKIWLRRRSGSGTIQILNTDGGARTPVSPTGLWQPFTNGPAAASIARWHGLQIVTSGDSIDAYNAVLTSDPCLCSAAITSEEMQEGTYLWELQLTITEV